MHHPKKHGAAKINLGKLGRLNKRAYVEILVAVIIVAFAYFAVSQGGARSIGSTTTLNVTSIAGVIRTPYGDYVMYVHASTPGSDTAQLYVSRLPLIANPIFNVTLQRSSMVKLNIGAPFTNLEATLVSVGTNQIRVTLTPVDPNLAISPTSQGVALIRPYVSSQSGAIPIN